MYRESRRESTWISWLLLAALGCAGGDPRPPPRLPSAPVYALVNERWILAGDPRRPFRRPAVVDWERLLSAAGEGDRSRVSREQIAFIIRRIRQVARERGHDLVGLTGAIVLRERTVPDLTDLLLED